MLQLAHETIRSGPIGNTMSFPFSSASILGPSAPEGSVKLIVEPKITG